MPAPLIVYLHGFRSSPLSVKARAMVRAVDALPAAERPTLVVPDLGHSPAAAIATVLALVDDHRDLAPVAFVGSSLGGYYATWLAERLGARAALINPAVRPFDDLAPYRGTQTNMYSGERFEVTDAHFEELRALAVPRITRPDRYFLLVQSGDEVLDWREAVSHYAGAWQFVQGGGDHAFEGFDAQIPAILRFTSGSDSNLTPVSHG
jgi:predicted esterase YcpF (UPF0227 family)